jgi:GNAT superfamily N-acetyltransferase
MDDVSPGWTTDLAILKLTGSTIEDRGDHLLVRSPANPDFHWGNCLFVADAAAVDDAQRWVETFTTGFPTATWVAIGLTARPSNPGAWAEQGLQAEWDDVLNTDTLPRQTPLADGYLARRLDGDDWEQYVLRDIRENARTGEYESVSHERFIRAQTEIRRSLSDQDDAAFFGAFTGGVLVADLGIVRCGTTARYQSVGTDPDHRRRGLAGHLLGLAARWAQERGCGQWVIVTEVTNPAGRLYRSVGFTPTLGMARAYRRPPV